MYMRCIYPTTCRLCNPGCFWRIEVTREYRSQRNKKDRESQNEVRATEHFSWNALDSNGLSAKKCRNFLLDCLMWKHQSFWNLVAVCFKTDTKERDFSDFFSSNINKLDFYSLTWNFNEKDKHRLIQCSESRFLKINLAIDRVIRLFEGFKCEVSWFQPRPLAHTHSSW